MKEKNIVPYNHISVLIMPTDYCNMNCAYCFNYRRTYDRANKITLETVKKVFEITIPFYREVKYIWHGGEPLSMGIDFYKEVIRLQNEMNTTGTIVLNSIQTNITLMTEEFADFLILNKFHIGSSYDGITNNLTRHNTEDIMKGYNVYKDRGGKNGFIYVIQKNNINKLIDDYEWFKTEGINYSLNTYVSDEKHVSDLLSINSNEYIENVNKLFDYWIKDRACTIKLGFFDEFLSYFLYGRKSVCCYSSCMGRYVGILYDGTIINCNRDFPREYNFGNAHDYKDIREAFNSAGFNKMLKEAIKRRNYCRDNCEIFSFCQGGCNSNSYMTGDISQVNSFFCDNIKGVYHHIEAFVETIKNVTFESLENDYNPELLNIIKNYYL